MSLLYLILFKEPALVNLLWFVSGFAILSLLVSVISLFPVFLGLLFSQLVGGSVGGLVGGLVSWWVSRWVDPSVRYTGHELKAQSSGGASGPTSQLRLRCIPDLTCGVFIVVWSKVFADFPFGPSRPTSHPLSP